MAAEPRADSATVQHVEGHGQVGQGRGVVDTATCSCGWYRASDAAHYREWRHRAWTDHIIAVLLQEVADLRSRLDATPVASGSCSPGGEG